MHLFTGYVVIDLQLIGLHYSLRRLVQLCYVIGNDFGHFCRRASGAEFRMY